MSSRMHQSPSATPEVGSSCRLKGHDTTEMLAWLDYCVAKGFKAEKFKGSILGHLKRTRQRDFTWAQIDEKIKYLWSYTNGAFRAKAGSNYSVVYDFGTKAFGDYTFKDEERKSIRARVRQMMEEPVVKSSRKNRRFGHRRKRKTVKHISPSPEVKGRSFERTKRPFVEISLYSTPESLAHKPSTSQAPPTPSKSSQDYQPRDIHGVVTTVRDSESVGTPTSPTISSISSVVEDIPALESKGSHIQPEIFLTPAKKHAQPHMMYSLSETSTSFSENNPSCSLGGCETIWQLLANSERDVNFLRRELAEAQHRNEDLERKLQSEGHTRAITANAGGTLTEKTLKHYLNEIEILRSRLTDKEFLCPFTTRAGKKHMPFDHMCFRENMRIIRDAIRDFMTCAEMSRLCNVIDFKDQTDELRLLFQRVIGDSQCTLQDISFHSLLRSLLSAAVCEWVFECDVTEPFLASTPLRETMLSHLTTQDGEDVARNLDFAAHYTLIEGKYFQEELIPRRASDLAVRLSATIAPLFALHKPLNLWEIDVLSEWNRQRPALQKIFASALRVKVRALVCKDVFEVVFPSQAHGYDRELMEIEKLDRNSGESVLGHTPLVRLCLVPGLRKYPFDRKLVDYNSFQKPGDGTEGPSDLIAKPIVIIN